MAMKIRKKYHEGNFRWERKKQRLEAWHRWFAWHPARVHNEYLVWLEMIERKGEYGFHSRGADVATWGWQYRLPR